MQNWLASLPHPAVVGTTYSSGIGLGDPVHALVVLDGTPVGEEDPHGFRRVDDAASNDRHKEIDPRLFAPAGDVGDERVGYLARDLIEDVADHTGLGQRGCDRFDEPLLADALIRQDHGVFGLVFPSGPSDLLRDVAPEHHFFGPTKDRCGL
jgi:hypothetical protein